MVISDLRSVSQWHRSSNSAYRLLLTLAPQWQLQDFQHQADRASCSSLLSQEQVHCKWCSLKFAFVSWANIVWFLATETMFWPQLKFSFTYVNYQLRMKVWTCENKANPGQGSNTEKSERGMNMAAASAHQLRCHFRWQKDLVAGRWGSEGALEVWSFLTLPSVLPEFPSSLRHLHEEGVEASLRNTCEKLGGWKGLLICGSLGLHDGFVTWRDFQLKHMKKVGERVDFWALSLAVSCLLTSVVLFLTHGWGRVRVLTQLFFVMKWTPTHWREKSPMLLAEGRAPAKNFSPSFDHCFTFLNHWGGGDGRCNLMEILTG